MVLDGAVTQADAFNCPNSAPAGLSVPDARQAEAKLEILSVVETTILLECHTKKTKSSVILFIPATSNAAEIIVCVRQVQHPASPGSSSE